MSVGVLSGLSAKESLFEIKIHNFSLSKKLCYCSSYFKFEGETWNLMVFTNRSDGCIDLRLWNYSNGSPLEVEFSVSVKTIKGTKSFERRERYCFKKTTIFPVKYDIYEWIYTRELSNRQTEFLPSGCITILLTMKRVESVESHTVSAADICFNCKKSRHEENFYKISVHKRCSDPPIMCPNFAETIKLLNWLGHDCQTTNVKMGYKIQPPLPPAFKPLVAYILDGCYKWAEAFCREELEILEETRGPDTATNAARLFNFLAFIYKNQNRYKKSTECLHKALSIFQKTLGENDLRVADVFNNLVVVYHKRRMHKKAEHCCLRAAEIMKRVLDPNHPDVQEQFEKLSIFSEKTRKCEEAGYYQRAINICKKIVGPEFQPTATKLKID